MTKSGGMGSGDGGEKLPSHHRLAWPTLTVMKRLGRPAHNSEILAEVATLLNLSPEMVAQPLGRGRRTRLEYKLSWSRTLLKGIGAIEKVEPAVWAVTERGQHITEEEVAQVTAAMLDKLTKGREPPT